MSLIPNDEKKQKEELLQVFITFSLRKIDYDTDKKNCLSMFETIKKSINKKKEIVEQHLVVMEFGKDGNNPHLHLIIVFNRPLNWTQVNRMFKNPIKLNVNPLNWSKFSCRSKKIKNLSYLLDDYLSKDSKSILLSEYNIDWEYHKLQNDIYKSNNLHKEILQLKYINKNVMPHRIIAYAMWKELELDTVERYRNVIEIMYRDNYNMSNLYMSNSLMKQTYNCICVLKKYEIDYRNDYNIGKYIPAIEEEKFESHLTKQLKEKGTFTCMSTKKGKFDDRPSVNLHTYGVYTTITEKEEKVLINPLKK